MGIGFATGKEKAEEAARMAITSPLLETSIDGAKGVIVNITASADIGLDEISLASSMITDQADADANIIWGAVLDENMEDEMSVTVIATGFASDDDFALRMDNNDKQTTNGRRGSYSRQSTPEPRRGGYSSQSQSRDTRDSRDNYNSRESRDSYSSRNESYSSRDSYSSRSDSYDSRDSRDSYSSRDSHNQSQSKKLNDPDDDAYYDIMSIFKRK